MHRIFEIIVACALVPMLATGPVLAESHHPITDWYLSGNASECYAASLATGVAYDGSGSGYLASIEEIDGSSFGTLMQSISARLFLGERLKLSAYVMTESVTANAALWMRIDGHDGEILGFDNMLNRQSIRGSQAWRETEIVLDVPLTAKRIAYGVLLRGAGEIWIDSISVEPVYRHIAVTGIPPALPAITVAPDDLPTKPLNLDFESGTIMPGQESLLNM